MYEKVGEATETALTVLVEKLNVTDVDKRDLSRKDLGTACNRSLQAAWRKDFTLEFSRDRKSMSSYCLPLKPTKLGPGPKMFVKVSTTKDVHQGEYDQRCSSRSGCLVVRTSSIPERFTVKAREPLIPT